MADPNLVLSGLSDDVTVDDVPFRIDVYRLEHDPTWTVEVIDEAGTSSVWDETFNTDQAAFDFALAEIRSEGGKAFRDGGDNVVPFKR
ncbi:MAG: hypothetical protein P8Q48_13180 [Paracoccaceae bacterium]|nr:hypothetical protein [Paracoccaceae bacterium]